MVRSIDQSHHGAHTALNVNSPRAAEETASTGWEIRLDRGLVAGSVTQLKASVDHYLRSQKFPIAIKKN